MDALTVKVDVPRDLLGALEVPKGLVQSRLKELIALELFRERRISSGKCAEFLGIRKIEFVQILARNGVAYFTETPDEIAEQTANAEQLLASRQKRALLEQIAPCLDTLVASGFRMDKRLYDAVLRLAEEAHA